MYMKDSNRTRKRIVALLLSQNGRITSGENDSLLRWMFKKVTRGDYTHEKIGDLKQTLINMARDEIITLEHAEKKSIRITAVELSTGAKTDTVDEEDFDLFLESGEIESIFFLVSILRGRIAKLERDKSDIEEAFDALVDEEQNQSTDSLEKLQMEVSRLGLLLEGAQLRAESLETELERLEIRHKAEITSIQERYQKILGEEKRKHEAYRKSANKQKSIAGQTITTLTRQLEECTSGMTSSDPSPCA